MQYGTGSPEARWRTQGRDVFFLGIVSSSWEPSKPLRVILLSINFPLENEANGRYYSWVDMMHLILQATTFRIIVY